MDRTAVAFEDLELLVIEGNTAALWMGNRADVYGVADLGRDDFVFW